MEYNWQYIFTGQSEWCPPQHQCYCDGYGICLGGTDEKKVQEWLDMLREWEMKDEVLDDWRDQGPEVMGKHAVGINKVEAASGSLIIRASI